MRIGVFDSGIGGLTVLKSLLEHKLFEEIIYYGDTARVPYGGKDKNTIIRYGLEAVEFFKNFEIDLIITACNTVSAYALEEMREQANCDIVGVIEPGVDAVNNKLKDKDSSILIIGTNATISSNKYELGLNKLDFKNLNSMATGLFVPLVEEGITDGELMQSAMNHYFNDIQKPDAIILGCTHFPLISPALSKYFNDAPLIHSGEAIVDYLKTKYKFEEKFEETELKFFASENPEKVKNIAKIWLEN